jgi:hypothetical protein
MNCKKQAVAHFVKLSVHSLGIIEKKILDKTSVWKISIPVYNLTWGKSGAFNREIPHKVLHPLHAHSTHVSLYTFLPIVLLTYLLTPWLYWWIPFQ